MKDKLPYKHPSVANILLLVALLFINAAVYSQDIIKDSLRVQKIIQQYTGKNPNITLFTINDPQTVNFLTGYIETKAQHKKYTEKKVKAAYNSTPGRRYVNGDKNAIPLILEVLHTKDKDSIDDLFNQMEQDYDSKTALYLDPEIKNEIFKLIEDTDLEPAIVQFLGYNKVEGYTALFEKRLLSGKSTSQDRLAFWLSYTANEKALDYYVLNPFNASGITPEIWCSQSLDHYIENGTPQVKQKVLDFAYTYLSKYPITADDLKPRYSTPYTRTKFVLYELVIKYGNERSFSVFKNTMGVFKSLNPENTVPLREMELEGIAFYKSPEKKAAVIKMLNEDDFFFRICKIIFKDTLLYNDPEVITIVFKKLEAKSPKTYELELFIEAVSGMSAKTFKNLVAQNIREDQLKEKVLKQYALSKQTLAEACAYLYNNGLVEKPLDINLTKEQIDPESYGMYTALYKSLDIAGIDFSFDMEAGLYPVDYDVVLQTFIGKSNNKIKGLQCYLQYFHNTDQETVDYNLLVAFNGKCFILHPSYQDDWYDIPALELLLDTITKEAGIPERFVSLDADGDQLATYIFGKPKNVAKLIKDYQLDDYLQE